LQGKSHPATSVRDRPRMLLSSPQSPSAESTMHPFPTQSRCLYYLSGEILKDLEAPCMLFTLGQLVEEEGGPPPWRLYAVHDDFGHSVENYIQKIYRLMLDLCHKVSREV
jgi:hypothetical protein